MLMIVGFIKRESQSGNSESSTNPNVILLSFLIAKPAPVAGIWSR